MTRSNSHRKLQDQIGKGHKNYVLITCDEPSANGEMNVEMSYEGDPTLLSYLLEGAQDYVNEIELVED
ncbi:MAG: hypothetical protein WD595_06735 [Waddliaceae bacterium]